MNVPLTLEEEPWLRKWLEWFLDRLESPRSKAITRRISKTTIPALFQFSEETAYRWKLLEKLSKEYSVFEIILDHRLGSAHEIYENAQLRLNRNCENLLREWLDRPVINPTTAAWQEAVELYGACFEDKGHSLISTQPNISNYTPEAVVKAFVDVSIHIDQGLTLREISARCFRGNSKFLDNRQELLSKLYGQKIENILARPLLLTAWAPPEFNRLLIIENQDTFLRLVDNSPPDYAILYSGGFRASAARLNSPHTRFAFLPGSAPDRFKQLWLSNELNVYFWGDLDFSGMGIIKSLKQTFPQIQAWQPGYQPMLEILVNGKGHLPAEADKSGQIHPGKTGCDYCDTVLLTALEQSGTFIDQEAIDPEPLC